MALAKYEGSAAVAGATVTVYLDDTLDLATLYEDTIGTRLGNPFTANEENGDWQFFADDALAYDIVESS